jgi:hypothetical protein
MWGSDVDYEYVHYLVYFCQSSLKIAQLFTLYLNLQISQCQVAYGVLNATIEYHNNKLPEGVHSLSDILHYLDYGLETLCGYELHRPLSKCHCLNRTLNSRHAIKQTVKAVLRSFIDSSRLWLDNQKRVKRWKSISRRRSKYKSNASWTCTVIFQRMRRDAALLQAVSPSRGSNDRACAWGSDDTDARLHEQALLL